MRCLRRLLCLRRRAECWRASSLMRRARAIQTSCGSAPEQYAPAQVALTTSAGGRHAQQSEHIAPRAIRARPRHRRAVRPRQGSAHLRPESLRRHMQLGELASPRGALKRGIRAFEPARVAKRLLTARAAGVARGRPPFAPREAAGATRAAQPTRMHLRASRNESTYCVRVSSEATHRRAT